MTSLPAARTLLKVYDAVIVASAVVAGAMLAAVSFLIAFDVVLRNLLISPPPWIVPVIEYGLLYVTMLAAPWLVRTRGHVIVEILHQRLSPAAARWLERAVYLACIVITAVVAKYLLDLLVAVHASRESDVRAITIPHTVLYAPMLFGFVLMGCEFLRYLLGAGSMYQRSAARRGSVE